MLLKAQKFRFGLFIIVASLALIGLVAVLTSQKFLQKRDIYFITYENISVSGLEVGSPVKYLGINVGTIEDIYIDPENISKVVVKISLKEGTPIKKDARADIATIGITGLKMIEIRGGSQEAELLEPGGHIKPGTSITEQITGKAEVIAEKLELLLNNLNVFTKPENMNRIIAMAENSSKAFENANQILVENRENLNRTFELSRQVTLRLDSVALEMNLMAEELNEVVSSDTLKDILLNIRDISLELSKANMVNLIKELGEVIAQTNDILNQMDHDLSQGSETFNESMRKLRSSLEHINEASRQISEDPSILIRGTEPEEIPDKMLEK